MPAVDGSSQRSHCSTTGMDDTGQVRPARKSTGIDVAIISCVPRSRVRNSMPSSMPNAASASENSTSSKSMPPKLPPRG